MLDNKGSKCGLANVAELSVRRNEYVRSGKIAAACWKFLKFASLLPKGGFLGWQIDMKTFSNTVFSSSGIEVTMEDINWIFRGCATASPFSSEWMEELYAGGRKVYMISPITDTAEQKTDNSSVHDGDEQPLNNLYIEMFDMMAEMDAVIWIIARSTAGREDDNGMIFISLPDELALRMRVLLSLVFPHMTVEEAGKLPEEAAEMKPIPDYHCSAGMYWILSGLICREDDKKPTDKIASAAVEEVGASTRRLMNWD